MNLEKFKTIITDRIAANKRVCDSDEEFSRFFSEQVFTLKMIAVVEDAKLLAYDNECLEYVHNLQNSIENLEKK